MNVRVRCVAADSIYANNANRKFCTKYGISTSFVRKGRAAKDEPLRKVLRSELSKERATRLEGKLRHSKATHYSLSRIKAKTGKTGNTVDFLWNTYGKCHTDDRKIRNKTAKAAWYDFTHRIEGSSDFFRNVMSCRIELCEKARKNDNKNGIWNGHALSSSYAILFLETFTEYPSLTDCEE